MAKPLVWWTSWSGPSPAATLGPPGAAAVLTGSTGGQQRHRPTLAVRVSPALLGRAVPGSRFLLLLSVGTVGRVELWPPGRQPARPPIFSHSLAFRDMGTSGRATPLAPEFCLHSLCNGTPWETKMRVCPDSSSQGFRRWWNRMSCCEDLGEKPDRKRDWPGPETIPVPSAGSVHCPASTSSQKQVYTHLSQVG